MNILIKIWCRNTLRVKLYCLPSTQSDNDCLNIDCIWVWVISGMSICPVTNCLMRLMMTTWRHGAAQSCVLLWQAITSNNPNNSIQNHVGADQDGLKLISCCFYVSVVGVHQLSWVDEIIFAVCGSLDKTQTLTLTSEIWPGIIGAISFNVAPVIGTTEIMYFRRLHGQPQCPDVRPPGHLSP